MIFGLADFSLLFFWTPAPFSVAPSHSHPTLSLHFLPQEAAPNAADQFLRLFERNVVVTPTLITTTAVPTSTAVVTPTSTAVVTPTPTLTTLQTLTVTPTPTPSNCVLDCQTPPQCNTGFVNDVCGLCGPPRNGSAIQDCNGVCAGTATINACGICTGGNTGRPANAGEDVCNICGGNGTTCLDCQGVPFGNATFDFCGVCAGNNTSCQVLNHIAPIAGPNQADIPITLSGAGFTLGVGGPAQALVCTVGSGADVQVINATVQSVSQATCVLQVFNTTGTKPFTLSINGSPVPITVNYTVLATNPTVLFDDFTVLINTANQVVQVRTVDMVDLGPGQLVCVFALPLSGRKTSAGVLGTDGILGQYVNCTVPNVSQSQRAKITISYTGGATVAPGFANITYFAPAPTTTFGRFINSAAQIRVGFNVAVTLSTYPPPGQSLVGQSYDCSLLFQPQSNRLLTSDPTNNPATCSFVAGNLMFITPTSTATVVAGDVLFFTPGRIVTLGQLYSRSAIASITVQNPTIPPTPVPVINLPQQIGACTPLFVDGTDSYGNAGRSLFFKYHWSIQPTNAAINAVMATVTTSTSSFTFPAGVLTPNTLYTVSLSVDNFLQSSTVVQRQVFQSAQNIPTVIVPGSNPLAASAARGLTLDAVTTFAPCNSVGGTITFLWQQASGPDVSATLAGQNTLRTIFFPVGTLPAGQTIVLNVTATQGTLKATYSLTIDVDPPSLEVYFAGGIERTVGVFNSFTLTLQVASPEHVRSNVEVTFACQNPLVNSSVPQCVVAVGSSSLVLQMPAPTTAQLPAGGQTASFSYNFNANVQQLSVSTLQQYQFLATVRNLDTGASYNAAVNIVPLTGTQLVPTIDCARFWDRSPLIPLAVLSLAGASAGTTTGTYTYTWTSLTGTVAIPDIPEYPLSALDLTDPNVYDGPMNAQNLLISPASLLPTQIFEFRLDVSWVPTVGATPLTGYAIIRVDLSDVPTSGSLAINPDSGAAADDLFTLTASDWTADSTQLPLLYAYRFIYAADGSSVLLPPQPKSVIQSALPMALGTFPNIDVELIVLQSNGAYYPSSARARSRAARPPTRPRSPRSWRRTPATTTCSSRRATLPRRRRSPPSWVCACRRRRARGAAAWAPTTPPRRWRGTRSCRRSTRASCAAAARSRRRRWTARSTRSCKTR